MRHRGPDQTNQWVDKSVGLGAVRLAILDPAHDASQPMHDTSGRFHLVFNGEIYNFESIRRELEALGQTFRTCGDTEVVLIACMKWGVDAMARFNGMWSLAFYDSHIERGFLSRDRFGIKPLFYSSRSDGLRFASELEAYSALDTTNGDIDTAAVRQLLRFGYIAHPSTIYRQVCRLAPAHVLEFEKGGVIGVRRYYDPNSVISPTPASYTEAQFQLRSALDNAVTARRMSDVPIGAFLSGGTDSTILAYHLQRCMGRPIDTFSIGYSAHGSFDESSYARSVAASLNTQHHELMLSEFDVIEAVPKILDHLSEPFGDSSIIPTSLLSAFARQHVKVALSGDGADELFAGYWRYAAHDAWQAYQRMPAWLRSRLIEPLAHRLASSRGGAIGNRVRQLRKLLRANSPDPLIRHIAWSRIISEDVSQSLIKACDDGGLDDATVELANTITAGYGADDPMNCILAFDLQHGLPADMLHKVDAASMMHSLEVRVPFLDPQVVSLAWGMPSQWKIDRGRRKRVLVDAYRGLVPDIALDRPKQGFEVPVGEMLRGPLYGLFRDVVDRPTVESCQVLNFDAVERLLADHCSRRAEHADILFTILSLCWWLRKQ